jgi:hypothetical protein
MIAVGNARRVADWDLTTTRLPLATDRKHHNPLTVKTLWRSPNSGSTVGPMSRHESHYGNWTKPL